jgi:hypothetical protein
MECKGYMRYFYGVASCLFLMLLLLPLADETMHISGNSESAEKRALAKMPEFRSDSLQVFSRAFENYYADNFGFRNVLVDVGAKFKYHLFNASPSPDKVACGSDRWLFLTGRYYEITQDLSRENLYSPEALKAKVKEWEGRKAECAARSIRYYNAFWPDKHYIYSEHLPFSLKFIQRDTLARCDQAIAFLKQSNSPVQMLDVREDLLKEKTKHRVYSRGDSHWNEYGAFIGYYRLMQMLQKEFPQLKPFELSDFNITYKVPEEEGDLATIIKVDLKEEEPVLSLKNPMPAAEKLSSEGYPKKTIIYKNTGATTPLRVLIYRDSFTNALIPYLMNHFSEIVLIWDTAYSIEMVERVKPDLVLECYASRYFR